MRKFGIVVVVLVLVLGVFWIARRGSESRTVAVAPESKLAPTSQTAGIVPVGKGTVSDPVRVAPDVSVTDEKQVKILDEVLAAKNDNDPRLDAELRNLGPGAKRLMRDRYGALPAESRNERGTIVFLVGRNLATEEDFHFLEEVLKEPACLSLADCRAGGANAAREELHDEMGSELTLAYPQAVAIKMSETYLRTAGATPQMKALAWRTLETARSSPVAIVARNAEDAIRRLKGE